MSPDEQLSFSFDSAAGNGRSGLVDWRAQRRAHVARLASAAGLPIGHRVRLTLISGLMMEGCLLLEDETLWVEVRRSQELRLRVGQVDFCAAEVESCVRLD
ncbi:MAG: hypothetical protein M3463_18060 [Verrucomicrobiota bacterium]|nr:hypothetical protein [Verrucomicrobiota bacterium]